MPTKDRIIDTLGEAGLLLPEAINRGLADNDRAKYWLSLLQMAKAHADAPDSEFSDLRRERIAADIADARFDRVVEGSTRAAPDRYHIPEAR
ncbi:MAG: hypothetical protein JO347_09565, partial [Candidatus Eremiobacteraeota bacterium]|nr:hypothetical protein [Candidatus Eremiobacteraeota bacterium]